MPRDQGNAPRDGDCIAFARFGDEWIGIGGGMQGIFGALGFVGAARKKEKGREKEREEGFHLSRIRGKGDIFMASTVYNC